MKQKKHTGGIPLKKLPFFADIKIRMSIFLKSISFAWNPFEFSPIFFFRRVFVVTLSFLIFVSASGAGLTAYAYESSAVGPESVLYDVKRNLEEYKLEKTTDTKEKADFYLTLSQRRLNEADYISHNTNEQLSLMGVVYAAEELDLSPETIVEGLVAESTNFQTLALETLEEKKDEISEDFYLDFHQRMERNKASFEKFHSSFAQGDRGEFWEKLQDVRTKHHDYFDKMKHGEQPEGFTPPWIEFSGEKLPPKMMKNHMRLEKIKEFDRPEWQEISDESQQELKQTKKEVKKLIRAGKFDEAKEKMKTTHEKYLPNVPFPMEHPVPPLPFEDMMPPSPEMMQEMVDHEEQERFEELIVPEPNEESVFEREHFSEMKENHPRFFQKEKPRHQKMEEFFEDEDILE